MIPNQVVFIEREGAGGFIRDEAGHIVERTVKTLCGLAHALPRGMFATYTVRRFEDGREWVEGVMQARDMGGRRYFTDRDETAVQRRLLRWSGRILRERAREGA